MLKLVLRESVAFEEQWRPTWSTMQLFEYGLSDACQLNAHAQLCIMYVKLKNSVNSKFF